MEHAEEIQARDKGIAEVRARAGWGISGLVWLAWLSLLQPAMATETVTLYVTNAQGTVVAEMTPQGQVTYEATYRPYGEQVTGVPQAGPGYTGHVNDPDSGLVYMQARYYDPDVGRFLSADPVGPNAGNGFNFNRYAYANNNPAVNTDPSGMCSQPGVPDPICPSPPPPPPQSPPHTPDVSPAVQRMRDTADHGGIWQSLADRSSFTAEGAAAFGPGLAGAGTKQWGHSKDSVEGSLVVGEGLMIAATYNLKVWSGTEEPRNGFAFTVDPSSYLKVKLGAGLALGVVIKTDPYGNHDVSISVGGGIGEEVIYKPPVNIGLLYNVE